MLGMVAAVAAAASPACARTYTHARSERDHASRSHAIRHHRQLPRHDRAESAIVGGHFARAGQFPWVARVLARRGRVLDACTGTVAAAQLILTAGHCAENAQSGVPLAPADFEVQTGSYVSGPLVGQSSRVSRVLIYPGFEPSSGVGDAALLELSTPTTAPPLRLAGETDEWPAGTSAVMTGWGRPGHLAQRAERPLLRWAKTVVQSPQWCAAQLRGFFVQRELCAMNTPSNNTAGCAGDSGGPLFVTRGTQAIEIGVLDGSVVGSKDGTCVPTEPTVYASSSVISRWVREWVQRLTSVPITVTETAPPSP
jgi:secreted trypsin-like serine protease